jgi:hypothetical protein
MRRTRSLLPAAPAPRPAHAAGLARDAVRAPAAAALAVARIGPLGRGPLARVMAHR